MTKAELKLLRQALRPNNPNKTVAPEYAQQWNSYCNLEARGYVENFTITNRGLAKIETNQ